MREYERHPHMSLAKYIVNLDANFHIDEECTFMFLMAFVSFAPSISFILCCALTILFILFFAPSAFLPLSLSIPLLCSLRSLNSRFVCHLISIFMWVLYCDFLSSRTIKCRYLIRNSTWSDNLKATFNWYIATEIRDRSECLSAVDVLQNAVWIAAMCHVREWVLNAFNNLYYVQEMNEVNFH